MYDCSHDVGMILVDSCTVWIGLSNATPPLAEQTELRSPQDYSSRERRGTACLADDEEMHDTIH